MVLELLPRRLLGALAYLAGLSEGATGIVRLHLE